MSKEKWKWVQHEPLEEWPKRIIGDVWNERVYMYGNNDFFWYLDGTQATYREVDDTACKLANGLMKLGVKKGSHIAFWMTNYPELFYGELSFHKIGAVNVPLNMRFGKDELRFILNQAECDTIIMMDKFTDLNYMDTLAAVCPELKDCEPGDLKSGAVPKLKRVIVLSKKGQKYPGTYDFYDVVNIGGDYSAEKLKESIAKIDPDDISHIIFTSGTTGRPKGAVETHDIMMCGSRLSQLVRGTGPNDRLLCPVPLNHVYGLNYLWGAAWLAGACVLPMTMFEPKTALEILDKGKATFVDGVPTMHVSMLQHPDFYKYDLSRLRAAVCCAAPPPLWLAKAIKEKFVPNGFIQTAYGQTEQPPGVVMSQPDDSLELVALIGTGRILPKQVAPVRDFSRYCFKDPVTGEMLPPHEEGELCFKGRMVCKGYYNDPESTAAAFDRDGWFHTGDLGFVDLELNLHITGRSKEIYIQGGENIAPREIEICLSEHPKIQQAYVVGLPDERLDEVGGAFVQLKEGETMTAEEVKEFVKGRLASFKAPRYVKFVTDFPLTTTGKVQKFKLVEDGVKEFNLEAVAEHRIGAGTKYDD